MIADLKARAEGFDRKRIYTAVAVLVIAGAAGHLMQRGAGGSAENQALRASVPAAPVPAPAVAAATTTPTMIPPTSAVTAAPDIAHPEAEADVAPQPSETTVAEAMPSEPTPDVADAAIPQPQLADAPLAAGPAVPLTDLPEEVTRSAAEPILAVPETPDTIAPDIVAAADDLADPETMPVAPAAACEITLEASAQDGALMAITLSAPCNAGEAVDFDTSGLRFSEQLGPEGDLHLLVPAMTETAIVTASLAGGQQKAAEVTLPDFSEFERIALVWKGATGLQLHVLENGARYGEPGHIWADTPASVDAALTGIGGFVSVLGSTTNGYAADVYTYPAARMGDAELPTVSIETQVMENTCGREIAGQILRSNAGRAPSEDRLTMAVPGCDAVGDYLVLNNLPQDLKLARN